MRIGWIENFECDLTDEQKRLCEWIADQAEAGKTRVYYEEAQAILGIASEERLTHMLRSMRERRDDIHDMVQSPIVNTSAPYFDIGEDADHIWDNYREAEEETSYTEHRTCSTHETLVYC